MSLFHNIVITHLLKLYHEFQCSDVFQWSVVLNNLKNCELSFHFFGALYCFMYYFTSIIALWWIFFPFIYTCKWELGVTLVNIPAVSMEDTGFQQLLSMIPLYRDNKLRNNSVRCIVWCPMVKCRKLLTVIATVMIDCK